MQQLNCSLPAFVMLKSAMMSQYIYMICVIYYGRTLSDASMLYFADVFFYFIFFFMAALVGQTAERIFTKLSHVVDIRCYLRTY